MSLACLAFFLFACLAGFLLIPARGAAQWVEADYEAFFAAWLAANYRNPLSGLSEYDSEKPLKEVYPQLILVRSLRESVAYELSCVNATLRDQGRFESGFLLAPGPGGRHVGGVWRFAGQMGFDSGLLRDMQSIDKLIHSRWEYESLSIDPNLEVEGLGVSGASADFSYSF